MALRWITATMALLEAGFMMFDGIRALTVGDYLTPSSGEYAGQLGPWSSIVQSVGIEPRSALMKWIFVAYGIAWLVAILAFVAEQPWAWWAMVAFGVGSLWYLVPGTVVSLLVLVLLLLPSLRAAYLG